MPTAHYPILVWPFRPPHLSESSPTTTPDLQATPFQPENVTEAPAFLQASTPGYNEATATSDAATYSTAYDTPAASSYVQRGYGVPDPDTNAQGAYGAEAYGQPDHEQATYAAGQQVYGRPVYGQPVYDRPSAADTPEQWIVALFLTLFLGVLGIHNFYLDYTTKDIIQLVLTITMIGTPITAIWAFIEFIMIVARSGSYAYDAQGQSLQ